MCAYLTEIKNKMPHIFRFELLSHSNNKKAIDFYKKHGFFEESRAEKRIRNNFSLV